MRKSLVILVALAAFGCSDKKKAPEVAADGNKPAAGAPAAAGEQQQAQEQQPTEAELRIEKIRKALTAAGLAPQGDETLARNLGNLPECKATERRRYNLAGEELYVIVGTFPNEEAAGVCMKAYQAFLGGMWDQFKGDFYQQGRFVLEVNPKMAAEPKEKLKKAVAGALG